MHYSLIPTSFLTPLLYLIWHMYRKTKQRLSLEPICIMIQLSVYKRVKKAMLRLQNGILSCPLPVLVFLLSSDLESSRLSTPQHLQGWGPVALLPVESPATSHFPSCQWDPCSLISCSFWPIINPSVGHIGGKTVPVRCGWKAVHVPSCRCVFWQVTCLARVQLQSRTPSRASLLLATPQRRGRISCYSPLSRLPAVTTCTQPSPVTAPFLLQVKVRNHSSRRLPRALKRGCCPVWDESLGGTCSGGLEGQLARNQPHGTHMAPWAVRGVGDD